MHPTHNPHTSTVDAGALTPAVILRGAARYLELHGFHQGNFYPEQAAGPFPPACAAGAIHAATCGRPVYFVDELAQDERLVSNAAKLVLAAHLGDGRILADYTPLQVIADWNDVDGRTRAEVIEALRDAADDWDWRHTTPPADHTSGGDRP